MNVTDDELLEIIEDVTVTLGQTLLFHRELTEGLFAQPQTERSQQKIDDLKKRLEVEKDRLTTARRSQQRKRKLEKIRDDHAKDRQDEGASRVMLPISDHRGRVIGWLHTVGTILGMTGRGSW